MTHSLFHPMYEKHQAMLEQALVAIQNRGYWSPYSENAHVYGDGAIEMGRRAFDTFLNAQFYLDQPGVILRGGAEVSPYGFRLNVSYPMCSPDALIAAGKAAMPAWAKAGADTRAGVCLEILTRLNDKSMEIAHAVMHTTGQSLMTAFQSCGPHAQDRGLEAVALAYREMKQVPDVTLWKRPHPEHKPIPIHMEKTFRIAPRGVALVIACSTFPTWHAYPGLFASLVTGNAVIVKAHPQAVLPLAITVAVARATLKSAGFDPGLISLLVDVPEALVTRSVALHPEIRIIDYTGNRLFGEWLLQHVQQADLYVETGGVNCIVIDSSDDYEGMLRNLAITLSLNSGQMKTTPQTLFVPAGGITVNTDAVPAGKVSADEFGVHLSHAIGKFLDHEEQAIEVLGAIQSSWIEEKIEHSADIATVLRDSVTLTHPQFPKARLRTPMLLKVALDDESIWMEERTGPITCIVKTSSTAQSLSVVERTIREHGAMTFSVYSIDTHIQQMAEDVALRVGVALSFNLTDGVYVNQTNGFSDFQGTGANPAGNACLASSAFVARRFFIVPSRRHLHPIATHGG